VFSVPDVGAVVGGNVCRGIIRENDKMLIGPTEDGSFHPIVAHSIHRNKLPCRVVQAGQACSLGLQRLGQRQLRKVTAWFQLRLCFTLELLLSCTFAVQIQILDNIASTRYFMGDFNETFRLLFFHAHLRMCQVSLKNIQK
jgi:hypothetical protein